MYKKSGKTRSEVANALEGTRTTIRESLLVSAYDIHHDHIPKPSRYFRDKVLSFVDSGGYELSVGWDSTEPKQGTHISNDFTETHYREVLARLPERIPIMIANFDWGTRKSAIANQIRSAQRLFAACEKPGFLTSFIIKPGKKKILCLGDILPHIEKLRNFNCIGVVEKELGENLLDKLTFVARLRHAMRERQINLPIHIWGGLDPVATPLYFFAGADIFDGVSWLRYAYHNGVATCRESYCMLNDDMGLGSSGPHAQGMTLAHNIAFLGRLKERLCQFVEQKGRTFKMFDELSDSHGPKLSSIFQRAFKTLLTKVSAIRGDD